MIIMPHPFSLPLVLSAWAIDIYILIIVLRLIVDKMPRLHDTAFSHSLRRITEPVGQFTHRLLSRWMRGTPPNWVIWATVVATAYIVRQILVWVLCAGWSGP